MRDKQGRKLVKIEEKGVRKQSNPNKKGDSDKRGVISPSNTA